MGHWAKTETGKLPVGPHHAHRRAAGGRPSPPGAATSGRSARSDGAGAEAPGAGPENDLAAVAARLDALEERLAAQHGALVGIPTPRTGIADLLERGLVDEVELVWLAAGGALASPSADAFVDGLAPWKRDLIGSGLIAAGDPDEEARLTDDQRSMLGELRLCGQRPVERMRSIGPLARHGHLDPEKHHRIAERHPGARIGVEGIACGVRLVGGHTSTLVGQGVRQAALARRGLAALGTLDARVRRLHRAAVEQCLHVDGARAAIGRVGEALQGIGAGQAEAHARARESAGRVEATLGRLEVSLGSVGESLREIEAERRWRELDSRFVMAAQHLRDATVLLAGGRGERALRSMELAVSLAPADACMFYHRALCHAALEQPGAARADLDEALALLPIDRTEERLAVLLGLARVAHAEALAISRAGRRADVEARLTEAVALVVTPAATPPGLQVLMGPVQGAPCAARQPRGGVPLDAVQQRRSALEMLACPAPWSGAQRWPLDARAAPFLARLALDVAALGNDALVVRCVAGAARARPRDLLRGGLLALPALQPLRDRLEQAVRLEARGSASRGALDWYALAALCTRCVAATEAEAVRSFRRGAELDPEARARRADLVRATIVALTEDEAEPLLAVLRRDRCPDWAWLAAL